MIRILAVLLLALPTFGTTVTVGTDGGFSNGMPVSSGTFTGATDPTPPFNTISGVDDDPGSNASFSFSFVFSAPSGVTSATILLSLWDLDSGTTGDQIGLFKLNNSLDLTTELNAAAEASPVGTGRIGYVSLNLPSSAFPLIETGTVSVALMFQGPATAALPPPASNNGGGIDFARLTFDTGVVTPEPSSLLLAAGGGLALLLRKRFMSRN